MNKVTAVLIAGDGLICGGFSLALYSNGAVWWSWLGLIVLCLLFAIVLAGRAERQIINATIKRVNRILTQARPTGDYARLPLAETTYRYKQGRK